MNIPYLDLSVRNDTLKDELLQAVDRVLSHGRIVLGPEVSQFEEQLAKFCQKKFVVGVNSGSAAVYLALRSLDIGPGDEVITTPLSWIATLNAIVLCGATPIFADIGDDLNINVELIEDVITPRTKILLPVHFTGKLCDMSAIEQIAAKHNLLVVEDAAQAFGASISSRKAGSFGYVNAFSMNAMKVFRSYGEAGAVATDDESLYEKLISLRYAGTKNRQDCHYPSLNFRLHTLQAAMLLVNFTCLPKIIARRRKIAGFYSEALKDVVMCPSNKADSDHVYYTYTIIADKRDELQVYLQSRGIETKIHHPILMPYHTAYAHLPKPHIPHAERLVKRILSIPNHEDLTTEQTGYIADCIREFYGASHT